MNIQARDPGFRRTTSSRCGDAAAAALRDHRTCARRSTRASRRGPRRSGARARPTSVPPDGDARRHLGRSAPAGQTRTTSGTRTRRACASSRPGSSPRSAIPLRRGRDVSEPTPPRPDGGGRQRVVREADPCPTRDWTHLQVRLRQSRPSSASSPTSASGDSNDERAAGLPALPTAPDNCDHAITRPRISVVGASTPLERLVPAVRAISPRRSGSSRIADVRPMTDIIDAETASRTVQVRVLAGFALIAFLLAAIGVTACSRSPSRSGRRRSACGSRSARSARTSWDGDEAGVRAGRRGPGARAWRWPTPRRSLQYAPHRRRARRSLRPSPA